MSRSDVFSETEIIDALKKTSLLTVLVEGKDTRNYKKCMILYNTELPSPNKGFDINVNYGPAFLVQREDGAILLIPKRFLQDLSNVRTIGEYECEIMEDGLKVGCSFVQKDDIEEIIRFWQTRHISK